MSVINTNIKALYTQNALLRTERNQSEAMQQLATGKRINSARDDAAGLAISQRMTQQIRSLNMAVKNAGDAISLIQTAEGATASITDMLQRMRELAVQAGNATNTTADRGNLDAEFQALNQEVTRTIGATRFNGISVIGGGAGTQTFQVGENSIDRVSVITRNLSADGTITSVAATAITSADAASTAMVAIDNALSTANVERAQYGAAQNRFEAIIATLQVASTNNAAARGRIMDADFAAETANLSRAQILQQAGTAMMAQANQMPQQVLQLLRG